MFFLKTCILAYELLDLSLSVENFEITLNVINFQFLQQWLKRGLAKHRLFKFIVFDGFISKINS
jgi:hypothetical protein